jgi:hypothetical protein
MDDGTLAKIEQAKSARRKSLAQYRANHYQVITLEVSGLEIWVRDASMSDLMLLGNLPQGLLNLIVAQSEDGDQASVDLNKFAGSSDFGALVNGIVKVCVVEPPVADTPDADHLGIEEIPGDDRMQIFAWANREVAPVADKFRQEATEPAPAA